MQDKRQVSATRGAESDNMHEPARKVCHSAPAFTAAHSNARAAHDTAPAHLAHGEVTHECQDRLPAGRHGRLAVRLVDVAAVGAHVHSGVLDSAHALCVLSDERRVLAERTCRSWPAARSAPRRTSTSAASRAPRQRAAAPPPAAGGAAHAWLMCRVAGPPSSAARQQDAGSHTHASPRCSPAHAHSTMQQTAQQQPRAHLLAAEAVRGTVLRHVQVGLVQAGGGVGGIVAAKHGARARAGGGVLFKAGLDKDQLRAAARRRRVGGASLVGQWCARELLAMPGPQGGAAGSAAAAASRALAASGSTPRRPTCGHRRCAMKPGMALRTPYLRAWRCARPGQASRQAGSSSARGSNKHRRVGAAGAGARQHVCVCTHARMLAATRTTHHIICRRDHSKAADCHGLVTKFWPLQFLDTAAGRAAGSAGLCGGSKKSCSDHISECDCSRAHGRVRRQRQGCSDHTTARECVCACTRRRCPLARVSLCWLP